MNNRPPYLLILFTALARLGQNLRHRPPSAGRGDRQVLRKLWQTCGYGLVLLASTTAVRADLWPAEAGAEDGWKSLPWFGVFYSASSGNDWIYHQYHGWNYAQGEGLHSLYLYMPDRDRWTWSAEGIYPWVYDFAGETWLYYADQSQAPRWFYSDALKSWQTAPTEILTRTLLAEMHFPDSIAIDRLPPRDFYAAAAEDEVESPFSAQLGFVASNQLYSETANVFPHGDMTAVLRIELSDGMFTEDDSVSIQIQHQDSSGQFESYSLSVTQGRLALEPLSTTHNKPFAPLPVGESEVVWPLFQSGFFTVGEYRLKLLAEIGGTVYLGDPVRLWVNPAEPSPDPDNLIADTGFRPVPDGFGFDNFTSVFENDLTALEVAYLLGSGAVIAPGKGDELVLTPMARFWKAQSLESAQGGHCLGLAFAAFFLYQGDFTDSPYEHLSSASDIDPTVSQTIELQQTPMRNMITYFYAIQKSGRFFEEIAPFEAMPPTEVLDGYIDSINSGTPAPVLLIRDRNGKGGHGVTPYAVSAVGGDIFRIHVYDNNYPADHGLFIEIDRSANTWLFGGIRANTGEFYEPYGGFLNFSGDAGIHNLAYVPYNFLTTFERELNSQLLVSASAPAQLFIFRGDDQIGFDFTQGEYVENFPGGQIRPAFDSNQPPSYTLPGDPLPPESGLDEIFDSIIYVEVGIPTDANGASSHSVNVMAGTERAGAAIESMNLRPGETVGLAFHQSGRVAGLIADNSPVVPKAFSMKVNDPYGQGGYIYAITDLKLEPENGLILVVDDDFELFPIFIEDSESPAGPPPAGLYSLSVIRVTSQGEEIVIH